MCDLQRHDAEDGVVDVVALGNESGFGAAGISGSNFLMSSVAQVGVVRQLREGQRAVPGADFAVKDGARAVLVRAGDEVFGEALPISWGERPAGQLLKYSCCTACAVAVAAENGNSNPKTTEHMIAFIFLPRVVLIGKRECRCTSMIARDGGIGR